MSLFGNNSEIQPRIFTDKHKGAAAGTGRMPVVGSDELADGNVDGAGDSARVSGLERLQSQRMRGGGDLEASEEVSLIEGSLLHELLDAVSDAFLRRVVGEFKGDGSAGHFLGIVVSNCLCQTLL